MFSSLVNLLFILLKGSHCLLAPQLKEVTRICIVLHAVKVVVPAWWAAGRVVKEAGGRGYCNGWAWLLKLVSRSYVGGLGLVVAMAVEGAWLLQWVGVVVAAPG